jgi:hypothetical protein
MDQDTPKNTYEQVFSPSSLADVLGDIEPSLPESLFGEECRRQMRRVAARLPTRLSDFWGFECRLGEPEPFSDILFEIRKETPGPALLAGERPSAIDDLCEAYPLWKKFRALARNWTNPGHAWNRDIHNLWLEMDLAGADAERVLRQPNIFFGPEPETSGERVFELIEELMPVFERPAFRTRALREFFDCLPPGARVFQIGFMLDRADDAGIRLCVDKWETEPEKILPWLAGLWPDRSVAETESLRKVFEAVFPLCRALNFGFDLTKDGVGDAFGVECYQEWIDDDAAQWSPLLDEATRAGLCLPEKARGVRDYAGITASPLRRRIDGGVIYLNTYRKIHHLKIALSRGTLTRAKAYLAVSRPGLPVSLFGLPNAAADADRQAGDAWSVR